MVFERSEEHVRILPLRYDSEDPDDSACRLILALRPNWQSPESKVEFVRFTDGITNTLLKAVSKRPGLSSEEIDREAILLRAYGHGTDLIIDRQREAHNHELLMRHGLAPPLLARFENGMMYRFVRGSVTRPEDMRRPNISKAIARRLAEWHATVPCIPQAQDKTGTREPGTVDDPSKCGGHTNGKGHTSSGSGGLARGCAFRVSATGKPEPNVWSVMQKWILALPADTVAQRERRAVLQKELDGLIGDLSQRPGLGTDGLVFSHNDLLSGNIIVLPASSEEGDAQTAVAFIDYEYAVPAPAAFDIANHFAEWGGFDCDMSVIPTVAQRRVFIDEYMRAYADLLQVSPTSVANLDTAAQAAQLLREVDVFRGIPGFFWGIWALIQATISEIDFDYASYAETRLSEYWEWKAEINGERLASGAEMSLRERRWAQENDDASSS